MYADFEDNKRLVRFGDQTVDGYDGDGNTTSTTKLTGNSKREYDQREQTVDWLLARYNMVLAHAVLYDAGEIRIRVWDHFGTVFSYVKLFGLMHRIYPIDVEGTRVNSTDEDDGYEAVLDGPASLFRKSQKYGIRIANVLPALPLCDRWEMTTEILPDDTASQIGSHLITQMASSRTTALAGSSTATSNGRWPGSGNGPPPNGTSAEKRMSSTSVRR